MTPRRAFIPEEHWYTLAEASLQLSRSPGTIRWLLWKHQLHSRKVRQGKHPRLVLQIHYGTLQRLRRLTGQ